MKTGKTSLLQHLLQNKEGIKIAVIVNDVASVNIDSKLVSGSSSADGMVQLQNGCACCSLADELLGRYEWYLCVLLYVFIRRQMISLRLSHSQTLYLPPT
jgi:CobW/HypB/UreG, nucleotide-binding domain